MGLAEWPARRLEGWASYAATTFPLLRGTLTVTVGVLTAAGLVEIWGRFSAAGRIVDALLYVAAGSGMGGLAGTALLPWLLRPLRWLGGAWNEALVQLLSVPVAVYGLLLGVYGGVLALVPTEGSHWAERPFRGAVIVLITYTLIRLVNGLTRHYLTRAVERGGPGLSAGLALTRKISNLIILALGVTFVISQMGYKITPLLTSLGIAGIAVAMALQDTLANLFAGFYMMMDRSLKPGDYVKLDTGDEGFIQDIGWRNTKIRPWANNIVVLPNTKLSQSVVTNHHLPVEETSVYVGCGVSYDSDLDHVEEVCIEVAREVMAAVPGGALDWNPVVRYKEFGESNIHFVVVLRVKEFSAQYLLTHEFIKALFRRFKQEGIEIAYPMRNVILRSEAGPQFRPSIRIASQE
jgi:small-conductance mechanosensitive channel